MPFTLVSLHAHPDDEAMLTGGTLARAQAEGHRVVLVLATDGGAGLAAGSVHSAGPLAVQRRAELERAALVLGCARVEWLGYDDTGMTVPTAAPPERQPFALADVEEAASALAVVLREERADVLTVYDPRGGYGHPDHVHVHRVGVRAAALAGTPVVLEATVDRDALLRLARLLRFVPGLPANFRPERLSAAFTARAGLTHRVDVRPVLDRKRAAMAAHVSQATADSGVRSLAVFLRLPRPVFRRVFGYEWYVERGRPSGQPLLDDVFTSLR